MKSRYASFIGLVASVGCIILCAIFLFWNPYSTTPAGGGTFLIVSIMLVVPACLAIVASLLNKRVFMYITFVWSLPYGLYFTVVSIPSLWNLFGWILISYFLSARLMHNHYVDKNVVL
jgi:hypothetical protein